ncbi:hypothetical protein MHYP_G00052750 [Metynnis hypsauchen]
MSMSLVVPTLFDLLNHISDFEENAGHRDLATLARKMKGTDENIQELLKQAEEYVIQFTQSHSQHEDQSKEDGEENRKLSRGTRSSTIHIKAASLQVSFKMPDKVYEEVLHKQHDAADQKV